MTAEEFYREKVRESFGIKGQMSALWRYQIDAETAFRWAHEFAQLSYNQAIEDAANNVSHKWDQNENELFDIDKQSILELKKL